MKLVLFKVTITNLYIQCDGDAFNTISLNIKGFLYPHNFDNVCKLLPYCSWEYL